MIGSEDLGVEVEDAHGLHSAKDEGIVKARPTCFRFFLDIPRARDERDVKLVLLLEIQIKDLFISSNFCALVLSQVLRALSFSRTTRTSPALAG